MNNILMALVCFAVMSGILGIILAVASKVFAVSTDERVEKITELLPAPTAAAAAIRAVRR